MVLLPQSTVVPVPPPEPVSVKLVVYAGALFVLVDPESPLELVFPLLVLPEVVSPLDVVLLCACVEPEFVDISL